MSANADYDTFGGETARQQARLPRAVTAAELQERFFEPVRWVVHPYIPQGLTLIAAKPKIGKSWLMLGVAVAVAGGGFTLGDRKCVQGDVLYAALEDGERRLKERMAKVSPLKGPWPERLTFWTEMQRLEEGGLEQIAAWAKSVSDPRLIILDTFAKVRSPKGREESVYEADYRQAGALKKLADKIGVAIVVVHHTRKMDADDPLDAVSGSTGLTGAADTILVMKRESAGVVMYGRGRDIEEIEVAMEFQKDTCRSSNVRRALAGHDRDQGVHRAADAAPDRRRDRPSIRRRAQAVVPHGPRRGHPTHWQRNIWPGLKHTP
jgi:hypothetical protein